MIKPTVSTLKANSAGILNLIRGSAGSDYYNAVPEAVQTTESIRMVGEAIFGYQPRVNKFMDMVNRIAMVIVSSKMYQNPWGWAIKGQLEFGESIEETFVNIAAAQPFNAARGETEFAKRHLPDIRSAFHAINLETQYPVTIERWEMRKAFLSVNGVTDLIDKIVASQYSARNYDQFVMMKYLIARMVMDGSLTFKAIPAVTDEASGKTAIAALRGTVQKFGFMSSDFNIAGVQNFSDIVKVRAIVSVDFDNVIGVDVQASAFNLGKVEYLGRRTLVDSFGFNAGEINRLNMLLANDPDYVPISDDDNTALKTISAVALDEDFLRCYIGNQWYDTDNIAVGGYTNNYLNLSMIYSASPFANVAVFGTTAPTVTAVTVSGPDTAAPEDTVQYVANVSGTDFVNKGVVFSISPTTNATINANTGLVNYGPDASGTYTITATSVFDGTKSGSTTTTVS